MFSLSISLREYSAPSTVKT